MSDECRIDVRTQGSDLELEVYDATLGPNPRTCPRRRPDITQDELDLLRAGKATSSVVDDVTARVSRWLQLPDLQDLPTILGFTAAGDQTKRIVFNVSHVRDERLKYELADFPIEMATPQGDAVPLSLHHRVSSIVHQLPKVGNPRVSAATGWPLKILIVRSGPTDLPAVPPVAAIANAIRTVNAGLATANCVQADVLSTEGAGPFNGPPTKERLRELLGSTAYHILVFLGHGDIRETPGTAVPVGQLQLETADRKHDSYEARRLSALLHEYPVPVVMLIGCLTAADLTPEMLEAVESEFPRWLRGSQGVAQALINGTSGVQCAVGMRYRVDGSDAALFLRTFFESLLVPPAGQPAEKAAQHLGDVEHAVRRARSALHTVGQQPLGWAAPVIFRTLGAEPMFPFVAFPPSFELPEEKRLSRFQIWEALAEIPWSGRSAAGTRLYARVRKMIDDIDAEAINEVSAHAVLILPERLEVDPTQLAPSPAEARVQVPLHIHQSIQVSELAGTIAETSQKGRIMNVILAPALAAAGFGLLVGNSQSAVRQFQIRQAGGNAAQIPAGPLLTVDLALGSAINAVYPLNVEALRAVPSVPLSGLANAVIVPSA
jgi:hypothetical protein